MKLIKISDREAFERLLRGEKVTTGFPQDTFSFDNEGTLRASSGKKAFIHEMHIPEPVRELTGWEALDALREGCCVNTGEWVYRCNNGGVYYKHSNQEWHKTGRSLIEFLELKYTLCTPDGVTTNDKEEAKWR